jgi:peptidyl-prolyl cis-trans isomerase D
MTNNIYKKQTKKINLDFINLENIYKKKENFSDDDIKSFINENKEQLKEEYIDFTYIKINPQNLIGSEEFSELFFQKIDKLENNISNGVDFNDLIKEIEIQPIKKKNYISNNKKNKIEEKIYQLRNKNKIQLIEENEFYVLFKIDNKNKILPSLNNIDFKNKVAKILYEKERYEFNHELLKKINNKKFNNVSFKKLSTNDSVKIEQIQLTSIKDNNKFSINSIKLLYAMPINSFTLVNDDQNNIYIARINKIFQENISRNYDEFQRYNNQANIIIRDYIYSSYDNFLNAKYKVNVNQKTLERVKNYFR